MSGLTSSCLDYENFIEKDNNNKFILKYKLKDGITSFSAIKSKNGEKHPTANSTSDRFYYPSGILIGWTTSSTIGINNNN